MNKKSIIQQKKYGGKYWSYFIEKYKIIYKKEARINLYKIFYYIDYDLRNPITAIKYIENMTNKIISLQYFPYRGAIYSKSNTRFLIYKKHLIFYQIQEKEKHIIIKRIIHKNVNL